MDKYSKYSLFMFDRISSVNIRFLVKPHPHCQNFVRFSFLYSSNLVFEEASFTNFYVFGIFRSVGKHESIILLLLVCFMMFERKTLLKSNFDVISVSDYQSWQISVSQNPSLHMSQVDTVTR